MSRRSNRSSKNTKRTRAVPSGRRLLSLLMAAAAPLAACLLAPAHAAGYVYQQHVLNAGVLVNGTGPVYDPVPYLFYVLNNRPDVHPTDLTLINPLAPPTATPNTPAYWEVPLNAVSDSEMAQYNVLYLRANGVSFGPVINEKLRRFVDNGGQLIVEYANAAQPLGLFTGTAATKGAANSLSLPTVGAAFLRQPIVSQPYLLSASDVLSLTALNPATPTNPMPEQPAQFSLNANGADGLHASVFTGLFSPALNNDSGLPVVSTMQMGAGQVVASTLNIGAGITVDPSYKNANGAFQFNPANFYSASTADLKLLANILAWSEAHPTEGKTSHGNAAGSGLASFSPAWQYATQSSSAAGPPAAAVWGNFVFAVDATGALSAFDAYPAENLTGTADTDGAEGISATTPKYPATSYDAIWQTSIGVGASAPTVAAYSSPNSTTGATNYVFVEKANGSLVAFNAVTGLAAPFTLTQPTSASGSAVSYPQQGQWRTRPRRRSTTGGFMPGRRMGRCTFTIWVKAQAPW